jgi:hypothetical protein
MGVSLEEYVRRLVAADVRPRKRKVDMSVFFGQVTDGPPSKIARDKDKMIAEAVWEDHQRSVGRRSVKTDRNPPR